MPKTRELTIAERSQIVLLHSQGMSQRKIAKQLKCSLCGVQTTLKRKEETNLLENRPKSGRKRVSNVRQDRFLIRNSIKDRFKTSKDLRNELQEHCGVDLSARTVRRRLQAAGLHGRKSRKKPLLSKTQIKKRLIFAQKYKNWTIDDWSKVIWSDESNVEVCILY